METINDLFEEQIKDLYNAEKQLLKALPKMAKKASRCDGPANVDNICTKRWMSAR